MKNSVLLFFGILSFFSFTMISCGDEELGKSIFDPNQPVLDEGAWTYKFDKWLYDTYLVPYNLRFVYQMEDIETNMNYNLIPAKYINSQRLAVLCKYLWFDVYDKVAGPNLLKEHGPRLIHIIGSSAYNPVNGTEELGVAEGGIKITLMKVNELNLNSITSLNSLYLGTMHHEFAHILNQTKSIPKDFNLLSFAHYDPSSWQDTPYNKAVSLGFVSKYAAKELREDFAETICQYIIKDDNQWQILLSLADEEYVEEGMPDGEPGKEIILEKLRLCKEWFREKWEVELDSIRNEVQRRQVNVNEKFINDIIKEEIGE